MFLVQWQIFHVDPKPSDELVMQVSGWFMHLASGSEIKNFTFP